LNKINNMQNLYSALIDSAFSVNKMIDILKEIENKTYKGSLGDRMKFYELMSRYVTVIPDNNHYVIRVDGRSFSSYTKGLDRPFDAEFINTMNHVALALCKGIDGAQKAFVQSDEISIHVSDTATEQTQHWFGGKAYKILGIASAIASNEFNRQQLMNLNTYGNMDYIAKPSSWAQFDSRIIILPNEVEVDNCFLWRQQDCERNSVSSVAQVHFSTSELHKKNIAEQKTMIVEGGYKAWEEYDDGEKFGRWILPTGELDQKWTIVNNTK